MTQTHEETERRLRAALAEASSQVRPSADRWSVIAAHPPARRPRRGFFVPAIAAALVLAVAVALTAGVVLLRGGGSSGVRTPATEGKETSPDRLLTAEADVTVYMRSDAAPLQVDAVRDYLRRSPDVREFAFVDKARAYEDFKRIFHDRPDLVASLDASALPETFAIRARDCASRPGLLAQFQLQPGVDEAVTSLGLSHANAERYRYQQGFPPADVRGRCGDRPPSVGPTYSAGG